MAVMASEPANVNEFQELARQALPKMYFDFYNGDVSRVDISTTILGYHTSAPIMIAPTAMHKLAHLEGEATTARAAASHHGNVLFVYLHCGGGCFELQRCSLFSNTTIKAMEVRVDGIVVFNHGACQLDYSPVTITVLEKVVRAVGGKIHVLFDGEVRRGTDIFKALAFGTQAVMVGRPVIYGLAAKGEYGVRRVIEMLKDELELTMALSSYPTVNDVIRNLMRTELDGLNCWL
ncbi:hypothetical protein ACSBR1_043678 [Camellia fascicularis]